MNAIHMLKQDHKKVKGLFRRFEAAGERTLAEKEQLATTIFGELELHTRLEEEIFYPEVANGGGKEAQKMIHEAIEEHRVVKDLIADLRWMSIGSEEYLAKFKVLTENVEHHVEEEEGEMFPQTQRKLGETKLNKLGSQMDERKQQLNAPTFLENPIQKAKEFASKAFEALSGNGKAKRAAEPSRSRRTRKSPTKASSAKSKGNGAVSLAHARAKRRGEAVQTSGGRKSTAAHVTRKRATAKEARANH